MEGIAKAVFLERRILNSLIPPAQAVGTEPSMHLNKTDLKVNS